MQIGNLSVSASALDVLQLLRVETIERGLPYFRDIRQTAGNIMTQCPFHKGGVERKPSFGISTSTMQCHCFTCGYAGLVDDMIGRVLGGTNPTDAESLGRRWLSKHFLSMSVENRPALGLSDRFSRSGSAATIVSAPFTEEELEKYSYYHGYMWKRGLNEEIVQKFDVGYDYETDCITFPVYHLDGSPAFIARRSVKGKFFNYPEGVDKPVYAANMLIQQQSTWLRSLKNGVLIVESIFNALTAWQYGWPALSLLGLGTSTQYEILRKLPIRMYTLAMDPDAAGDKAEYKLRKELGNCKMLKKLQIPEGYDINDLQEKFLQLPIVL